MTIWAFLWDPPLPGQKNMERDIEIMRSVAARDLPPVLRLYSWAPPALSLGKNQVTEEVADIAACRKLGVDLVRRPTGGRAVLHWAEYTYSVTVPENYPGLPREVLKSYRFLSQGLVYALGELGIKASLAPETADGAGLKPGSCFDTPSAYEIQVKGKKVIGSAQVRRHGVLLQHGSILTRLLTGYYLQVLRTGGRKSDLGAELSHRAAGLYDLDYCFCESDLARALLRGMGQALGVSFKTIDRLGNPGR